MLIDKFSGTDYEMGFYHGKTFKNEIANSIKTHCNFGATQKSIDGLFSDIQKKLKDSFPEIIDELKGIADGADFSLREIIMLNYWEDIVAYFNRASTQCCTSIGFCNSPLGPIMGKTTDIEEMQRPEYMLQWISPDQGNKILQLGKVGTLKCEAGINDKGLCIGTSSTMPTDIQGSQIERMMLIRLTLRYCNDVKQAIDFLSKYNFYILGLNVLLIDLSGEAVVLEKGIAHQTVRRSNDDYIFATNFFVCEDMQPYYDEKVWYYQNALQRYNNLIEIFAMPDTVKDINLMKKILRDHSPDGAICNHQKNLDTYYALIMLPQTSTLYLCDGRPCESNFRAYTF